jgi:hypothetical protein
LLIGRSGRELAPGFAAFGHEPAREHPVARGIQMQLVRRELLRQRALGVRDRRARRGHEGQRVLAREHAQRLVGRVERLVRGLVHVARGQDPEQRDRQRRPEAHAQALHEPRQTRQRLLDRFAGLAQVEAAGVEHDAARCQARQAGVEDALLELERGVRQPAVLHELAGEAVLDRPALDRRRSEQQHRTVTGQEILACERAQARQHVQRVGALRLRGGRLESRAQAPAAGEHVEPRAGAVRARAQTDDGKRTQDGGDGCAHEQQCATG